MPRAGVIVEVDAPGEAEAAEAWIAANRPRLDFVSDQEGCGCCVLLWTVEGPEEVLATLPPGLRCDVAPPVAHRGWLRRRLARFRR